MTLAAAHLRVARPTDDIVALLPFYCDGLGFDVILRFKEHERFNGVMLGHRNMCYRLEFKGHATSIAPTQDNLLIFYLHGPTDFHSAVSRIDERGFDCAKSFNPYWDRCGKTFEDPDGYKVVLANMAVLI